jgi:hypothetical protein
MWIILKEGVAGYFYGEVNLEQQIIGGIIQHRIK